MYNNEIVNQLADNDSELRMMLETHLLNPKKVDVYHRAFKKCVVNGYPAFSATWSWYAFFGGPFYFFYRKLYVPGIIILLLSFVPLSMIVLMIASGVSAKFFYIKKFCEDIVIAGYMKQPADTVKQNLAYLGGFNAWALVVFLVLVAIVLIGLFFWFIMFFYMSAAAYNYYWQ